MSAIGDFIKNKRAEAGYSQSDLAKACGLKYDSAISKIENGKRKITLEELVKISKVLGNFHIFEAIKVAGFITDDDINPQLRLHHLDKLEAVELNKLQEVIDFFIYRKKQKEG